MKRVIFNTAILIGLSISTPLYAGISVCYDQNNNVSNFSLRGNAVPGCDYYDLGQNVTQQKYEMVRDLLKTVDKRYLKKMNGYPVEMSPAEKVAVDDAWAQQITDNLKTNAKSYLTNDTPDAKAMRNAFRVVMASLIETRAKVNEVINKGNIPNTTTLPNRTWAQVVGATKAQIDAESDPNT